MRLRTNCIFTGMNFLAHAYLSFSNDKILVGNMISDFVKGAKKNEFENDVRQGIMLHRAIDSFTDTHPATAEAKEIFRPHYRLYSGAIMDILYDHFLANDSNEFSQQSLYQFSIDTYDILDGHQSILPNHFAQALTHMKAHNWLYNYRSPEGMKNCLIGLVRRAAYLTESETAFQLFMDHYKKLEECYHRFFPDVKQFAKQKMDELLL